MRIGKRACGALSITKAEIRNAEAEVYRGPANAAEFKVTVKTADAAGTNAVVVTDLVPATFTVTGCGAAYTCEIVTSGGKVFTKLVWNLGDLPAGQTRELTYQAYVAEREVRVGAEGCRCGLRLRGVLRGGDLVLHGL